MAITTTTIIMKVEARMARSKTKRKSLEGKKYMPRIHKWRWPNFSKKNNQVSISKSHNTSYSIKTMKRIEQYR